MNHLIFSLPGKELQESRAPSHLFLFCLGPSTWLMSSEDSVIIIVKEIEGNQCLLGPYHLSQIMFALFFTYNFI